MIEGVREATRTRTRTVGEEETADYAESDEDEDGVAGFERRWAGGCAYRRSWTYTHI